MAMHAKKKGFKRKKVEVLTLGERLRLLRKERHVSMAEFSKATRIQVKYLRALEEGRYDALPSRVYIKGFLRSYAQFFGLERGVLDAMFQREYRIYHNVHREKQQKEYAVARKSRWRGMVITPRAVFAIGVASILLGIGGYLYYGINQFIAAPWIVIEEPQADQFQTTDAQVVLRGKTQPDATLHIGERAVTVNDDGSFHEVVGLSPGENTIIVRSTNAANKVSERVLHVTSNYKPTEPQPVTTDAPVFRGANITITTDDMPIDIRVLADDKEVFHKTVPPASTLTFHAENALRVSADHGNHVQVAFNGADPKALGDTDGPISDVSFVAPQQTDEGASLDERHASDNEVHKDFVKPDEEVSTP